MGKTKVKGTKSVSFVCFLMATSVHASFTMPPCPCCQGSSHGLQDAVPNGETRAAFGDTWLRAENEASEENNDVYLRTPSSPARWSRRGRSTTPTLSSVAIRAVAAVKLPLQKKQQQKYHPCLFFQTRNIVFYHPFSPAQHCVVPSLGCRRPYRCLMKKQRPENVSVV